MKFKVGDTLDFVGYKGKLTPVQIVNISEVDDHNKDEVAVFSYLDNSGRPNGTCRVSELKERDQKIKKETPKKEGKDEKNKSTNDLNNGLIIRGETPK